MGMIDKEHKKAIELVKRKLWNWNYRVTDTTKIPGVSYHLLVNEKYRVFVRTAKMKVDIKPDGSPYYEDGCDIVACVEGKAVAYGKSGQVTHTATMRPYEVMDLNK